ncbi:MAG: arylsulfotransferase (ASST) [Planctomycetes bacterium]|jgi:hypothetical protein|nr:arylsulfotransferase (ASST) [Planctomycetota bacterium]
MHSSRLSLRLLSLCVLSASPCLAQGSGVPFEGLTLFQPLNSTTTYLIDNGGTVVHTWPGVYQPGNAVYLLENDHLLRTIHVQGNIGGSGGGVQEITWDGTLVWDFRYANQQHLHHHDIERLPNGNVLLVAWENKTAAEAIAQGRNPAWIQGPVFRPDHVVEVQPTGTTTGAIVWEWHAWDHLIQDFDPTKNNHGVVADHPELIDVNFPPQVATQGDWLHVNAIDYNAELDQIVLSSHNTDEIYIIDHSTTTAEAAGHSGGNSGMGGDLLYRWGNPRAYDAGTPADQQFFGQHDAQWIEVGRPGAGNLLVFNNGPGRPGGPYSSVDELETPVDAAGTYPLNAGGTFDPPAPSWSYVAPNPSDFYSSFISGAQRQPNGNTLICSGAQGWFFEVTDSGALVWEYTNPFPNPSQNRVFRAPRYAVCEAPAAFCSTSPNSNGAGARMGFEGTTSVTANDLVLEATAAAVGMPGIFYFGPDQIELPFGDGFRCIGGSVLRLPVVVTDGSGDASFALDFTDPGQAASVIAGGDTWNFQFWFRDPAFGGATFNLSDALEVPFCD